MLSVVRFNSPQIAEIDSLNDELLCPVCGHNNLHQGSVLVGIRIGEDCGGTSVYVSKADGRVTAEMSVEPETSTAFSLRRDRITIEFWCEGCPGVKRLRIDQHKGCTHLNWEPQL